MQLIQYPTSKIYFPVFCARCYSSYIYNNELGFNALRGTNKTAVNMLQVCMLQSTEQSCHKLLLHNLLYQTMYNLLMAVSPVP